MVEYFRLGPFGGRKSSLKGKNVCYNSLKPGHLNEKFILANITYSYIPMDFIESGIQPPTVGSQNPDLRSNIM